MANSPSQVADAGLQPQRAGMAWSRSLFLTLANSLLCLRFGIYHRSLTMFACSGVLLMLAALMAAMSIRRFRFEAGSHAPGKCQDSWHPRLI